MSYLAKRSLSCIPSSSTRPNFIPSSSSSLKKSQKSHPRSRLFVESLAFVCYCFSHLKRFSTQFEYLTTWNELPQLAHVTRQVARDNVTRWSINAATSKIDTRTESPPPNKSLTRQAQTIPEKNLARLLTFHLASETSRILYLVPNKKEEKLFKSSMHQLTCLGFIHDHEHPFKNRDRHRSPRRYIGKINKNKTYREAGSCWTSSDKNLKRSKNVLVSKGRNLRSRSLQIIENTRGPHFLV